MKRAMIHQTMRKSDNDKYWVVFNESTGKILKFTGYKPANFKSMFI